MSIKNDIFAFIVHNKNKIIISSVCVVLAIGIAFTGIFLSKKPNVEDVEANVSESSTVTISSDVTETSSKTVTSSQISSILSSSKPISSATNSKPKQEPVVIAPPVHVPSPDGEYKYNTNLNIEDNLFMDALVYTGYNLDKHRADGNMWVYILAKYKRGLGYLSNITFGGGSSGYEITADKKPNIKAFEKGGLVCASFVTYVYFNYLPNVAGIDTSSLPRPESSVNANDWYKAAKKWIELGYSYSIPFEAKRTSEGYIKFTPSQEIPLGSILIFRNADSNADYGNHAVVYGGYKNGNHWVYHTGNKNGPEMCAVERMLFGPDPVFPICVISPPSNVRMSAALEITAVDESSNAVSNAAVTLKNTKTGDTLNIGNTDNNGKILVEKLDYTEYQLSITAPQGYTANEEVKTVKLTPNNNSLNYAEFTLKAQNQQ